MDAPGKVRFKSPLSRRQKTDHRPRKGGWPNEGSCRIFPGKIKSPHRSVDFGASGNQVNSEGQVVKARRTYKDGEKSQILGSCRVFPRKRYHPGQSKSLSCSEEHGAGGNQSKAVRAFPGLCAPHASVECRRLTW